MKKRKGENLLVKKSDQYRRRRAINFDLSIDALEQYYSASAPKGAYKDIEKYMENNGFEHRQWSGYCSKKPMSNYELIYLFDKMYETMPWLNFCVERMDATTIDSIYDIKEMRSKNIRKIADKETTIYNKKQPEKPSVLERLAENKKIINQSNNERQEKIHNREKER